MHCSLTPGAPKPSNPAWVPPAAAVKSPVATGALSSFRNTVSRFWKLLRISLCKSPSSTSSSVKMLGFSGSPIKPLFCTSAVNLSVMFLSVTTASTISNRRIALSFLIVQCTSASSPFGQIVRLKLSFS